ncbi:MAG: LPXTG cell wall anchor domain-containing protein, partial [Erysipelotrichaceae bacterium]|nr:LPXTG cell wall anchor domain-containing protein [Erysipelotrichaceae bacterium]
DGCADINIDVDGDGNPDLNIDVDGDGIPDTNIDSTADGKADTNLDTDGDGVADENIVDISEWKPEASAGKICTMILNPEDDDPDNSDPNDTDSSGKPNGEVQGSYYPGDNVGGALTGDTSNPLLYMGIGCGSIGILFFLLYKHKKEENN